MSSLPDAKPAKKSGIKKGIKEPQDGGGGDFGLTGQGIIFLNNALIIRCYGRKVRNY